MFGGTLQIIYPAMNQIGVPPGALEVSGNWTDRGMPEPYVLERITIWLDEDPGIEAQIARIVNPGAYAGRRRGGQGIAVVERRLALAYEGQATLELRADGSGKTITTVSLPRRPLAEEEVIPR